MPRRSRITIQASGRRYRFGRTAEYGGIWRKRLWGWRLVYRYPLTEEGWRVVADQVPYLGTGSRGSKFGRQRGHCGQSSQTMGARWWAVAALALLLVLAGDIYFLAQPSSSRPQSSDAVGTGYLAKGSDFVIFIQWNDDNGSLRGSAQLLTTSGQAPSLRSDSQTVSVTGSLQGPTITLSFNGGATTFGTLSSGSFTVNFPQSDGP